MNEKKTILVTGATGAQGGSVANALLNNKEFNVRILTRNAQSAKAIAIGKAGAEIFEGDLADVNSIRRAMKDVYAVFGVTNFWEHFGDEYQHGKNLIDVVNESGVKHFVYSSLPGYNKLSYGTLSVPHCDIKHELENYIKRLSIPATFVHVSFYYENFFDFFPLQKDKAGNFSFGFPQGYTKLAMTSVHDMGPIVAAIFQHPEKYIGRTVGIVGDDLSCAEYASVFTRILKQNVYFNYISYEKYKSLGFAGAEELAGMFEVQRLYIHQRKADLLESYELNPAMQSFETWVRNNKGEFAWQMLSQIKAGVCS